MKFFKIHHFILLTFIITTICNCNSSSSSDAFGDNPVIEPEVKFMYPEHMKNPESLDEEQLFAPNSAVIVTINKPVDINTVINGETFKIKKLCTFVKNVTLFEDTGSDEYINGHFEYSDDCCTIVFIPEDGKDDPQMKMDGHTVYEITLDGLSDSEGLSLDKKVSQFGTQEKPDEVGPYVIQRDENDDTTYVDAYTDKVIISFNEPYNPLEINNKKIDLYEFDNASDKWINITESVELDVCNNAILVKPKVLLSHGTLYDIVIQKDAIVDLAGLHMSDKFEHTFEFTQKLQEVARGVFDYGTRRSPDALRLVNGDFVICIDGYYSDSKPKGRFVIYNSDGTKKCDTVVYNEGITSCKHLALLNSGNFVICYTSGTLDQGNMAIYTPEGKKVSEVKLFDSGNSTYMKVALLDNNNFVVCYTTGNYYSGGKFAIFDEDGSWVSWITTFSTIDPSYRVLRVDIKVLDNGNFVIWYIHEKNLDFSRREMVVYDSSGNKIGETKILSCTQLHILDNSDVAAFYSLSGSGQAGFGFTLYDESLTQYSQNSYYETVDSDHYIADMNTAILDNGTFVVYDTYSNYGGWSNPDTGRVSIFDYNGNRLNRIEIPYFTMDDFSDWPTIVNLGSNFVIRYNQHDGDVQNWQGKLSIFNRYGDPIEHGVVFYDGFAELPQLITLDQFHFMICYWIEDEERGEFVIYSFK